MCMGMIKQVRIKRLYYGASIPHSSIKNKINIEYVVRYIQEYEKMNVQN